MPQDHVTAFVRLVRVGFDSVGFRTQVDQDGQIASVRDVFAEFGPSAIDCYRVSEPEAPFASFPSDAVGPAATLVCGTVLGSVLSRAIEARLED